MTDVTTESTDGQPLDDPQEQFKDTFLDNLLGEWRLSRRIGKRLEENHVRVDWVLDHQFLQIHMKDVKSPPGYEALVFIGHDAENQRYIIHWLDSFGGKFSEKGAGQRDSDSIRFVFQYPDGLLHNTFTWMPDSKTWRSLIEQQDEQGRWSVFAEDTLERL